MKKIRKGDIVEGLRPWNSFARIGVVISEPVLSTGEQEKCKVFWYAPDANTKLSTKRTFVLEELVDSIQRMEG